MISRRHTLRLLGAAAAGVGIAPGASAQTYPDKTVKMIVPAAPGGPTDTPARLVSQMLTQKLGQPVVVDHRPGAGGATGARALAVAPPDGYTLMMGNTSTLSVIPAVSKSAGYDPVKDFTPVARVTEAFQIVVVHPSSPWKTVKELVDYTKANPTKVDYAHSGPGGLPHLAGELFMLRTGAKMTGVPFRSGGESVNALLGQTVHVTIEGIGILAPLIQEGRIRALGAATGARSKLLPDLPTLAELGIPNAEVNTFYGVVAPAGTPPAIIEKLNAVINEGIQTAEFQGLVTKSGSEAKPNSPAEFSAYIAAAHKLWLEVGQAAGVSIN